MENGNVVNNGSDGKSRSIEDIKRDLKRLEDEKWANFGKALGFIVGKILVK